MCLYIPIFERAGKPIKVYKVLDFMTLESPVQGMKYCLDNTHMIDIEDMKNSLRKQSLMSIYACYIEVSEGLHSCRSLKEALKLAGNINSGNPAVFAAEIPGYASVAFGINGDIVSDYLRVFSYYYKPVRIFGKPVFYRKVKYHKT